MFHSFALLTIIRPRPVWPSLEGRGERDRFSPTASAGCFPSKVFPFSQAQPSMRANAVFFCAKDFWLRRQNFAVSRRCEGV